MSSPCPGEEANGDENGLTLKELMCIAASHYKGEWVLCNDAEVTHTPISAVAQTLSGAHNTSGTPYLLFYTRIDAPKEYRLLFDELTAADGMSL